MHDLNAGFRQSIKHYVLPYGKTAIAGSKLVPASAGIWVLTQKLKTLCDEIDEAVGCRFVVVSDVAPDFDKVTARSTAKAVGHPLELLLSDDRASRFSSSPNLGRNSSP